MEFVAVAVVVENGDWPPNGDWPLNDDWPKGFEIFAVDDPPNIEEDSAFDCKGLEGGIDPKIEDGVEPKGLERPAELPKEVVVLPKASAGLVADWILFCGVLLIVLEDETEGLVVALLKSTFLFNISFFVQMFQHNNCPLFVRIANLGKGSDTSTPLHGSMTLIEEVKSNTTPKGVSSSPESSSMGIVALSESLSNSTVLSLKKKSTSVDFEPIETKISGYSTDQFFKMRV